MLYDTASKMYDAYEFCTVPVFEDSDALQSDFEEAVKSVLSDAHGEYVSRAADGEDPDAVMDELIDESLEALQSIMD